MVNIRGWVVVGVNESDEAVVAARYALREAVARKLNLKIVHAYEPPALASPVTAEAIAQVAEDAEDVVNRVRSHLNAPRQVMIATAIRQTTPKRLLRRHFDNAQVIVIGQHHNGWGHALDAGRLAAYLATHAPCPTVVVPRLWEPSTAPDRPVIVAVDGETPAAGPLRVAFDEATARHSRLIVLRLHPFESSAREIVQCRAELIAQLALWKKAYPTVPVNPTILAGEPKTFITEAARDAALIIVGRPHKHGIAIWSRSATRAVLTRATCPLMVVPTEVSPDRVATSTA